MLINTYKVSWIKLNFQLLKIIHVNCVLAKAIVVLQRGGCVHGEDLHYVLGYPLLGSYYGNFTRQVDGLVVILKCRFIPSFASVNFLSAYTLYRGGLKKLQFITSFCSRPGYLSFFFWGG